MGRFDKCWVSFIIQVLSVNAVPGSRYWDFEFVQVSVWAGESGRGWVVNETAIVGGTRVRSLISIGHL